jgi:signal transduction histidine kinase
VTQHLEVEITAAGDVVTIGNPEHLARMFRNILDNAIRHAAHRVVVAATTTSETVQVEISDDGPGIPVEDRERVFDRFVRMDASREHISGSTGLGLAIAKEIATVHGGHIIITDSPGGGARVVVRLPRVSDDPQRRRADGAWA